MKTIFGFILMFLFAFPSFSQTAPEPDQMKISNRKIVKTVTVFSEVESVWQKWTTHEGLLTFFGEDNRIELTPGGPYEIFFDMESPIGLRGSEGCKVLSFIPNKMISFTWNAPPKFANARGSDYHTWVVVEFEPVCENFTKITLTHMGWPEEEAWDGVYIYFDEAWDKVLSWSKDSYSYKKPAQQ